MLNWKAFLQVLQKAKTTGGRVNKNVLSCGAHQLEEAKKLHERMHSISERISAILIEGRITITVDGAIV